MKISKSEKIRKTESMKNTYSLFGYALFWFMVCAAALYYGGFVPSSWCAGSGITEGAIALFVLSLLLIGVRKANEWERAVVLRLGKFKAVRGPGLYFVVPFIDRVAKTIDIRIRVTDFAAQETLTLDSVTVTVDALCFWLIWDPEKAVLELEDYEDAVILSSKTALRNAISSHDLTTFLHRGDIIESEIQTLVDKKTTEWGITVQHIEITDIQIPEPLQDSLSRLAVAEREKKSRILLAEAEIEVAQKLQVAVQVYSKDEAAMKLKILSILNEGLKAGNSMMLVPSSITEKLQSTDIFGLAALNELKHKTDKTE
ncbi:MAG: slipin family protein [Termitinemataceae bacterium]|nr:MAG: slipin family protein [Termitinemataceae bacterium]